MSNADIFIAFPIVKLGVGVAFKILKTAGAEGLASVASVMNSVCH